VAVIPANLAQALEERAEAGGWAHRPAFLVGDRVFSHAQVHDGAARTASLLGGLGVGTGDRVLLCLGDGIQFVWAFLACARRGAVAVPVNPRLTLDDHRYLLEDSGARLVVCPALLADRFGGPARVLEAEELEAQLEAAQRGPAAPVAGGAPAYAQYTSGTTGPPKAAVHRHSDPEIYFEAFAGPALGVRADDVFLSVSKMFFAYGLGNSLFFPLFSGCRAVLHAGAPRPDDVAALAHRHGVTVLFSVPTFYAYLSATDHAAAFASLRAAVSAGEPLTVALAGRARRFLGCPVLDGLGSTEVGQTFASNTLDRQRDGTVGCPLPPYRVSVRDDDGREVAPGTVGRLWASGPTVLLEYLGRPEATAAVKDGDWLSTGDRALVDADGFLHHRGRVDDIELVGGICVDPLEIEAVLADHDQVTELAVVARRDDMGASRLEAFVVLSPGSHSPDGVADGLAAMARSRLAPHKVPRRINFVDRLPRTPTGKLRRFVLRTTPAPRQPGDEPGDAGSASWGSRS